MVEVNLYNNNSMGSFLCPVFYVNSQIQDKKNLTPVAIIFKFGHSNRHATARAI
jgi:hypothetical protein